MKHKRIVVTGGAGFIGSHLCRDLLAEGHHVTCIDNLSSGNIRNIANLRASKSFRFIRHDIIKPITLPADEIYHLACPASPVQYQDNPIKTIKTNILGTMNMLGLAKRTKARILFSSTSEVYGDPAVHPQKETYWGNVNPIGIRSCYDEGKRCAESLCFNYHRTHNVDIRVIRIFNTYGPSMDINDGRVVSNFIVQALRNKSITIYGSGRHTRSFQYVDDLVRGMKKMMGNTKTIGPVNLGNPNEFTILELAKLVLKLVPESRSSIVMKPLPLDDPKRRKPDISLARKTLGWSPRVPLATGLNYTIAYFRDILRTSL
jgi:UDP-glucuronate decarboxylase